MGAETKDVWVFVETRADGSACRAGLELLPPGRALAARLGGALTAVVVGSGVEAAANAAGCSGAERVLVVDDPGYAPYSTDAYTAALYALVQKYRPACVLVGATPNGRDLAPRLACRLKTGLTADCTALEFDEGSGAVAWVRPALGGNLMARIICPDRRPQMGTVRPGVFPLPAPGPMAARIVRETLPVAPGSVRTQVLELVRELDEVDLEGAEIIVAGGLGADGARGFALVEALARTLGGVVGASRGAVDAGWISRAHQVGQTGKSVSPRLYIACGISGAVQHLAGMSRAELVVAVNRDPDAPIFRAADYGVVGDLFEVLPVFTEEIARNQENKII